MHVPNDAILLVHKPIRKTSFDIIRQIRKISGIQKVGHAGTLDPLATGLLIIATGKKTKSLNDFVKLEKEYTGTFTLGATTPTFDLESTPEHIQSTQHLSEEKIREATKYFLGELSQNPPIFSAIKQQGKPVYLAAREGREVVLQPRRICIYEFDITSIAQAEVGFRVRCSSGTYIRSLAHDFGAHLKVGAYLSALCRTKIGTYSLEQAIDIYTPSVH